MSPFCDIFQSVMVSGWTLIRFGGSGIGRMLLSNPLSVGLGRISYSLYLVHWPLYVFYRQGSGGEPGTMILLIISAVSVAVAVGMYRLIEQPFRFHRPGDRRASSASYSLKLIAGLTICLIAVSASMCLSKGWAWRFPDSLARFAKEAEDEKNNRYKLLEKLCNSENSRSCAEPSAVGINVFVIGDSHAPDALNALHAQYPQYHYILKQMSGCPPLVREDYNLLTVKHPDRTGCINRNEALLYQDQLSQADLVVINTVFSWYKPVHLKHTIIQIRKKTNAPIIVMGNYMFFGSSLKSMGKVFCNMIEIRNQEMQEVGTDRDERHGSFSVGFGFATAMASCVVRV